MIGIPCEIWIPAARPDVIHADNVARLKARLVVEGANIPCTAEAEDALAARGVPRPARTEAAALALIDEKIRANTGTMLDQVRRTGALPRTAALSLAIGRVRRAMRTRRWDGGRA